jgi:hypothetical protein
MPRSWPVLLVVSALSLVSAQADERIASEMKRLESAIAEVVPADSRGAIVSRLERGRTANAAGRTYLALYDLQVAFEAEGGYRLAAGRKEIPDFETFKRKWTQLGAPADPPSTKAEIAFIEALAQSAEGRAPATYKASLPYAQDAGIEAGLYYLGESQAMVRFAALCRSLERRRSGASPLLRSIEPELAAYEQQVVKAYDAAGAQQRPQFAAVNVTIKIARTLDQQQRYEGALLQYLVSRYRFALLTGGAAGPAPAAADLQKRIDGIELTPATDHSIAQFFLQLASATLSGPEPMTASAVAVLDDVLPAYFEVVKK